MVRYQSFSLPFGRTTRPATVGCFGSACQSTSGLVSSGPVFFFRRYGKNYGDVSTLEDENGIGFSYMSTSFTDVMIAGLNTPAKRMGWRHGAVYPSVSDVVHACRPVEDGTIIFGSYNNLAFNGPPERNNGCSALRYGFLLTDWSGYDEDGVGGCGNVMIGHTAGIVGGAIPPTGSRTYGCHSCCVEFLLAAVWQQYLWCLLCLFVRCVCCVR